MFFPAKEEFSAIARQLPVPEYMTDLSNTLQTSNYFQLGNFLCLMRIIYVQ